MPPAFAHAPALAIEGLLDYTKSEHAKIYKSGIRQVSDDPFDCEPEGLYQFLKDVHDRANEMGWTEGILKVIMACLHLSRLWNLSSSTLMKVEDQLKIHTCCTSVSWHPLPMKQARKLQSSPTSIVLKRTGNVVVVWLCSRSSSGKAT